MFELLSGKRVGTADGGVFKEPSADKEGWYKEEEGIYEKLVVLS